MDNADVQQKAYYKANGTNPERFTIKIVLIKESQSYCVYRNGEKIGWFAQLSNVLDLIAMEFKDALDV